MIKRLMFLAFVAIAMPLHAEDQSNPPGEIQKRLDKEPNFTFQTSKKPIDLEFCIADVLSRMAEPSAFRDGPNRSIVIANALGKVVGAIELNGSASGTIVIGHIYGKGWDDRMRERIHACL